MGFSSMFAHSHFIKIQLKGGSCGFCLLPAFVRVLTSLSEVCEGTMLLAGLNPLLASLSFPRRERLVASSMMPLRSSGLYRCVLLKQQFILELSLDSAVCDSCPGCSKKRLFG